MGGERKEGKEKGEDKEGMGRSRIINWGSTQGETFHLHPEGSLVVYLAMKDGRERGRMREGGLCMERKQPA